MTVYLISKDLLFSARVKEEAAQAGVTAVVLRTGDGVANALATSEAKALASKGKALWLVDLEKAPISLDDAKIAMHQAIERGDRCVSFFSHVHTELADQARGLELGEVMPRSRFVKVLPELLRSL